MQILRKVTLANVLLLVIAVYLGLLYHRLFLVDQDVENAVEFSQQISDSLHSR
jgi:hypothetical protein